MNRHYPVFHKVLDDIPAEVWEEHCLECGAPRVAGMDCWGQLGGIIAWEVQDPELAAEHFLTVASYNLQHPAQFLPEVLAGLQTAYLAHLDQGMPVQEIRRRVAHLTEGKSRVLKRTDERQPVLRQWGITIADVYWPDQPAGAAGRVRTWAAAIRRELV